jgi:PAS domain S-box-containing protein
MTAQIAGLDVRLRELGQADEAIATFGAIRGASPTGIPVLVVTDPDVEHPLKIARRIARDIPEMRFLFVVDAKREEAVRREAVFAAPPGNRWQLTCVQGDQLLSVIVANVESGQQAQRLRTTVDRMKLRLPAQPVVDSVEYRRLVMSDRYLASVLQNAQDAIVSINLAGSITTWNRGAQEMFGLTEPDTRALRLAQLFDQPALFEQAAARALSEGDARLVLDLTRIGTVYQLEASLDCLSDDHGRPAGIVVILRDISESRRVEAALREGNRQRDEFLAMLSHELRNPLAPIRAAADVLKLIEIGNPHVTQASAIIARQVAHMTALIDDLLDAARVTRGTISLDKTTVSMVSIVADAVEQTHAVFEAKRHRLLLTTAAHSMLVHGDRHRLVQVLVNLLSNSAKFTPEGGEISIDLASKVDEVVVTVSDNGVGIEAALLPHVFELFVQGSRSSERALGGLGIGLALVRTLTELHGGSVSIASRGASLGTSIRMQLPRARHEVAADGAPLHGSGGPTGGLDLMVVDDNADAAETLAALLQALGHRVEMHTDPRLALEQLTVTLPQALILDIGMPHVDGYEMARRIRVLEGGKTVSLIALTGYGQPMDRERALAAGFDHHLVKPLDVDLLIEILAGLHLNVKIA